MYTSDNIITYAYTTRGQCATTKDTVRRQPEQGDDFRPLYDFGTLWRLVEGLSVGALVSAGARVGAFRENVRGPASCLHCL